MRDLDIVLEADNTAWYKLPRPFFRPGDPRPHPPRENYEDRKVRDRSRIVVLIASLRESKIAGTLKTMFDNAVLPSRVFAGVVQQNLPEDPDALEELCRLLGTPLQLKEAFRGREDLHIRQKDEDAWGHGRYTPESLAACQPAGRVRMHRMDQSEAKGPAYARSHQPRMLSGSRAQRDFCLQIDAHTVFVKGWDEHLIDEWALTQNEYAVLTTYPMSATRTDGNEPVNDQGRWAMPHLCKATFEGPGIVRNSIAGAVANLQTPALTKFWAAGLSFSRCHAERDVPNDPGLTHIFSGEEFTRAARLWTNGYDMYTMMRPYVVTYYGSDKGGRGYWVTNNTELLQARARLAKLLRRHGKSDPELLRGYDLGTRRRYEDYMKLSGIDTVNERVVDTPCSVSRWTPWLEGAQPPHEVLEASPVRLGLGVLPMEGPEALEEDAEGPPEEAPAPAASARESRFLQAPGFAAAMPASGLHLVLALGFPISALGLLLGRSYWQRRSAGKST